MTAVEMSPSPGARTRSTVLLIDDHQLVTGALQLALEREEDFAVAGVASTIAEAVADAARLQPSLVITDLRLPDGEIHEELPRLTAAAADVKVLVVTGWPTAQSFLACVGAGAAGYMSKARPLSEVVGAARRIAGGEAVFPLEYVPALLGREELDGEPTSRPRLTTRELNVLQQFANGASTTEVARSLTISVNTVRNHLAGAMSKLGKSSRLGAVSEGVRLGLIAPPTGR